MFKTYNTLHICHNSLAGSRQAARGARICETSQQGDMALPLWSSNVLHEMIMLCLHNEAWCSIYVSVTWIMVQGGVSKRLMSS